MKDFSRLNNTDVSRVPFSVVWGISIIFLVYAVSLSYFLYTYMERQLVQSTTISYNKVINEYQNNIEKMSDFSFDLAAKYNALDKATKNNKADSTIKYTKLQDSFKEKLSEKEDIINSLKQQIEEDKKEYINNLKQKEVALTKLEKKVASIKSGKAVVEKQKKELNVPNSDPINLVSNKETLSLKGDIGQELEALRLLRDNINELEKSCSVSKNPDNINCLELARSKAELNKAEKKIAFMQAKMKYLVN